LLVRRHPAGALALVAYVIVIAYRLAMADWHQWETVYLLWDRDILAFFLIGMLLFGLGLVGEYVGRIYQQVRERPRYTIRAVLERSEGHSIEHSTLDAERSTLNAERT
jgi:undecaprenyl-phosphate 4-deoxy-4-formamido-L-arabinose transferase